MEREEAKAIMERIIADYGMKFVLTVLGSPQTTQDMICAAAMVLTVDEYYDLSGEGVIE
jgi:hypothetical protein